MLISGLNKTTLLDYPGRVAATVFTGGCNFRCPFCHNGGLVLSPLTQEHYTEEDVLAFLKKRKNILSGVCITGGEPTIQQDLPDFIQQIKELGLAVKLDTNGSHPHMLEELIAKKQIDYVAMDIKNAPGKYQETTGLTGEGAAGEEPGKSFPVKAVQQSVELLKNSRIPYEFRTTVVKEFHTLEDLQEICAWIAGSPAYYLQQFEDSGQLIAEMDRSVEKGMIFRAYEETEIKSIAECLNKIPGMEGKVHLRGLSGE
ncbi:MAG: anaerobic ribonucleoside-triphosphate reductase activating protein [Lachnospiraceae bacterium]|nr:anaerobic ribonucleoside-triphosphate reductase activating protein [Lachnospiraceae bacterium]